MALLESIGDPALTVGAGSGDPRQVRTGEIADLLRWSQTVIDWADGDPTKGNLVVGSPLAMALMWRGVPDSGGRHGWREDLDDAIAMAQNSTRQPTPWSSYGKHGWATTHGDFLADDTTVRELDTQLRSPIDWR